jgi:hypothetical protein
MIEYIPLSQTLQLFWGWKHRKTPKLIAVTQENFVKTWQSLITTATKTTYLYIINSNKNKKHVKFQRTNKEEVSENNQAILIN